MTQTEDRIKLMIDAAYTTDNDGVILESNFWRVARDVAAEIDALTRERDEARIQIVALEASNAEQAQMMADGFADAKEQSARLAEARAEVERLTAERESVTAQYLNLLDERNMLKAKIGALTRERNDARAEVERLRPAAEAWEAREALGDASALLNNADPSNRDARVEHFLGCQRRLVSAARAAKEAA